MSTDLPPLGEASTSVLTGRRVAYGLCWLILLVALVTVPMPFFTLSPGSAVEVDDLIEIQGGPHGPLDGEVALLAVSIARPSLASLIAARFDDEVAIESPERIVPPGEDDRTYFDEQAAVFDDAFAVSAAVALRAAGYDVAVTSLPEVVQVLPGSPADGVLLVGDLVLSVNGVAVETAEALVDQARLLATGDVARIRVERGGEEQDVEVVAGQVGRMTRPGLGVSVDTTPRSVDLPFDVHLRDGVEIGGPSAGLVFGLAVYDLVSDEDLLAGRRVTGTGTLELDGRVGRIGSIEQKVHAAHRAGYTIFLAPASQAAEAQAVAGPDLLVIPVETFSDALAALRDAPNPA